MAQGRKTCSKIIFPLMSPGERWLLCFLGAVVLARAADVSSREIGKDHSGCSLCGLLKSGQMSSLCIFVTRGLVQFGKNKLSGSRLLHEV